MTTTRRAPCWTGGRSDDHGEEGLDSGSKEEGLCVRSRVCGTGRDDLSFRERRADDAGSRTKKDTERLGSVGMETAT